MFSPVPFRVTTEPVEGACLIRAAGEVDMSSVGALRLELDAARREGDAVLLDLSDVTFLDSTGLQLLVEASRESATTDWAFFIVRPSGPVLRLIELSGTGDILTLGEPAAG